MTAETVVPPQTGPAALLAALRAVDLDALEAKARLELKDGKVSKRDQAIKLLNVIEGLRRNKTRPDELMITKVPVLPAQFRPFSSVGGTFIPGDANELYGDLIKVQKGYRQLREALGDNGVGRERLTVYGAIKALYGYGDPVQPKTKERGVSGFMKHVAGSSPKFGWVQRRLISKPVDTVSRGVIVVNPELSLNEINIPEDAAWSQYAPHIERLLRQQGLPKIQALKQIKDRGDLAKRALQRLTTPGKEGIPVTYSRAPAWHKFNLVAGWPRVVPGDMIAINPYVSAGMNADYNGDSQIGKILVLIGKNTDFKNQFSCLKSQIPERMLRRMVNKRIIPAFDTKAHELHLVDLEDFPHGDLQRHKLDGKNGEIYFYHVPPGVKVVALDEQTARPVWADVAFYSVHPQRLIELVDLSNGRQIYTDDDPRAIYGVDPSDPTWALQRTTPSDAWARNFIVPCVKDVENSCQHLGKLDSLPLHNPDGSHFMDLPLTFETGWLLGAIAGDGWWDKRDYTTAERRVYLSDLHGQNAARMHSILRRVFGTVAWQPMEFSKDKNDARYGDTVRHTFSFKGCSAFTEALTFWLGGEKTENSTGSAAKSLPDVFLLAGRSFREGLLCGVVDTDGSCSVSMAKGKPQLLCSMTSTSLRLASDCKFLAMTLGITSSIGFSKTTVRGNTSWIVNFSTPDCKSKNVFRRLASDYKREAFLNTKVSLDNTSLVFDKALLPDDIKRRCMLDIETPKIRSHERKLESPELTRKRQQQNVYCQLWKSNGTISRACARMVMDELRLLRDQANVTRLLAISDLRQIADAVTPERVELWRKAIRTIGPKQAAPEVYEEASKYMRRTNRPMKVGKCTAEYRNALASWLETTTPYQFACDDSRVQEWYERFVHNTDVSWASITNVQKTGIREDGYDLTVPGYETFMSADGVILSNTINVHVPATDEEIEEAKERLMPDKMLFSIKSPDATMPQPKHESVLGFFAANQRPATQRHQFNTRAEALDAINKGAIPLHDDVEILDEEDTPPTGQRALQ